MTIRIVIADDSVLVRAGLEQLTSAAGDVEVVGVAADYDQLLEVVATASPDLLLTDIRMPPSGTDEGIRAANVLRAERPDIGVLVLSSYVEPAWALALLEGGSAGRGYLLKDRVAEPEQLLSAIRAVASGGSVIDSDVVEALVRAKTRVSVSPLSALSPRELDVLGEIAQGKNNAAIADALVLSQRAVEKHINSLFAKLNLSEEAELHHRVKAVLLYLSDQA
jgi:DNA-binding NarL/FixJ family response regulator